MKYKISKEFYQELKKEFTHLKTDKRKELIQSHIETIEQGDDRENDGFSLTSMLIGQNDIRLGEIRTILENCEVVEKPQTTFVDICSTVHLRDKTNQELQYMIVEPIEVDILKKKISFESELGKNLLGKRVGDLITFLNSQFKILAIF